MKKKIDNGKLSSFQQVRYMQIIMSFAINEIVKQIQIECIERAKLLKLLWISIIKEFNRLGEVFIREFDGKKAKIDEIVKSNQTKNQKLYQKIADLENNIKQIKDKEESKDKMHQQTVDENQALRTRITKISEVFDTVMDKKFQKLHKDMQKKKDTLIKSINDAPQDDNLYTMNDIFAPIDQLDAIKSSYNTYQNSMIDQETQTDSTRKESIIKGEVLIDQLAELIIQNENTPPSPIIDTGRKDEEKITMPLILTTKYEDDEAAKLKMDAKIEKYLKKVPIYDVGVYVNLLTPSDYKNVVPMAPSNDIEVLPPKQIEIQSLKEKEDSLEEKPKKLKKSKTKKLPSKAKKKAKGVSKDKKDFSITNSTSKPKLMRQQTFNISSFRDSSNDNVGLQKQNESLSNEAPIFKNDLYAITRKIDRKRRLGGNISNLLTGLLDSNHLAVIKERLSEEIDDDYIQQKNKAVTDKKAIINRQFTNLLKKDSDEEQDFENSSFYKMDEVATELPHKLLGLMEKLSNKLTNLKLNEYGDYILDPASSEENVEKIKKNAYALSKLLENIYDKKKPKKANNIVIPQSTQTEDFYMNNNVSNDRPRSQGQKGRQAANTPLKAFNRGGMAGGAKKQATSVKVTESQPFKFIHFKHRVKVHPVYNMINDIISNHIKKGNRSLMPIKSLVKNIMIFYNEKIASSKENVYFKNQKLPEFIYNSLYHRYGLQQVAERKFQELCISSFQSYASEFRIGNFAKFMGLTEPVYSNDDLNFYFLMNQYYLQSCIESSIALKKETLFSFDVPIHNKARNFIDLINRFFSNKINSEKLQSLIEGVQNLVKRDDEAQKKTTTTSEIEERTLHIDLFMSLCIDAYREIKMKMQEELLKKKVVARIMPYDEDYYGREEVLASAAYTSDQRSRNGKHGER